MWNPQDAVPKAVLRGKWTVFSVEKRNIVKGKESERARQQAETNIRTIYRMQAEETDEEKAEISETEKRQQIWAVKISGSGKNW